MYEKELDFLNKHITLIDNNKWTELFAMADDIDWTGDMWTNILTIFYDKDVNIDPLNEIGDSIPSYYFYNFNYLPSNFKIPNDITIIKANVFESSNVDSSIILSNNLEEIGTEAFSHCNKLTEITLPDSVTTIKFGAFDWCRNLVKVVLPLNLKYLENAFYETKIDCFYINTDDKSKVFPQGIYVNNNFINIYSSYDIVSNITGEVFGKLGDFLIK